MAMAIGTTMAALAVLLVVSEMTTAMMKLPMNSRMVESNTLPNTSSALATFRITHRHSPTSPVTGIGIASLIHQTTTRPRTAAPARTAPRPR
jgi:hypothetical protein